MKAIIFGTTGMVGKGVLLECLESAFIESVLVINRTSIQLSHPKLREIIHQDFLDFSQIENELSGYDACFFCMGVSVIGLNEAEYTRITHDITLSAARTLQQRNREMTFCYVSGAGTDSTENGMQMWARVKGKTENEILSLGFKQAFMFRPGYIQPMKGIKSKTFWYNMIYLIFSPLYPFFKLIAPKYFTTTINVGKAMIQCAVNGSEKRFLENKDINELALKL